MKHFLAVVSLVLGGCVHTPSAIAPGPNVGAVKSSVSVVQGRIAQARGSAEQIGNHLAVARNRAERIEAKARVVLEGWQ